MLHTCSMSNVLQQQHRSVETTTNIMSSVDEMFVGLDKWARFEVTSALMNLHQKKGQPAREHIMKVIVYLNKLEILRAEINAEIENHMVWNTLLDTFAQFKIDYELNQKDYSLVALMKDLQITENILKKKNSVSLEANMAEGPSSSKPNAKAKGKNKKKKGSGSTTSKKNNLRNLLLARESVFIVIRMDIGREIARST